MPGYGRCIDYIIKTIILLKEAGVFVMIETVPRGQRSRSIFIALSACLAITMYMGIDQSFAKDKTLEYKVKAAAIYNIIRFVSWPEEKLDASSHPIRIGVLGENPFGSILETLVNRKIKGQQLSVEKIESAEDAKRFHAVFLSKSEQERLPEFIQYFRKHNVLTIGDMQNFAELGGIVGFVTKKSRVKIEINLEAAKQSNLKISAKLLEVATIVN